MRLPNPSAWPRTTLVLISLVWGSSWIGNQIIAEEVDPLRAGILCFSFGWLALVMVALWQRATGRSSSTTHTSLALQSHAEGQGGIAKEGDGTTKGQEQGILAYGALLPRRISPRAARIQIGTILGCTMLGLPFLLLLWSAQHGSAAWAPLIYAALPLGLGLGAGKLQAGAILGVGAMLALLNGSLPLSGEKLFWAIPIVAAVALQGWSLVYTRAHLTESGSVLGLATQLQTAALLLMLVNALAAPHIQGRAHMLQAQTLVAAGALGVLVYAGGYLAYYGLLRVLDPQQVATSHWLQTLVAVGESAWLLRRMPGGMMLVSAAVLLACTWLLLRPAPTLTASLLEA